MIGRVVEEHKTNYVISVGGAPHIGVVRGTFHADGLHTFPKVGDHVECTSVSDGQLVIEEVLPRKTEIARKSVGSTTRQVMVANVDVMFVVMGLDHDFNLRRLERYLLLANQSGVTPVVILNKADAVSNPEEYLTQVRAMAGNIPVYAVSAKAGTGMEAFAEHIGEDTVAVLLGSSGAGKSTITNWLLHDDAQTTGAVRADDSRGRHTTTGRHMFTLPHGGFLIDTPGMRELGVLGDEDTVSGVFADIEALKLQCEYSDCDHEKSEGCAIQKAIADGILDEKRFRSYLKLGRERDYEASKADHALAHTRKQKVRKMHTGYHKIQKQKGIEREGL